MLCAVAVAACGMAASAAWLARDPRPWFEARHRGLASVIEGGSDTGSGYVRQSVRLKDASGLTVDLAWRREVSDGGRRMPVALILGGHLTGASAVRLVGETPGVMIAAISYPFDGDPRPSRLTFLRQIPRIRMAFLDTPPALQLAVDYLFGRPDVDTTRIEALGVSLGGPFVTIAGSMDGRISRVWVVHGSGGSFAPIETSMRRSIKVAPVRYAAAAVANVIIAGPRLAPEAWAADVAPRPFIMVNAADDERLSKDAVELLFARASHPKELIWMPGGHIHGDAPTIQAIVGIVLRRIAEPQAVSDTGARRRVASGETP